MLLFQTVIYLNHNTFVPSVKKTVSVSPLIADYGVRVPEMFLRLFFAIAAGIPDWSAGDCGHL